VAGRYILGATDSKSFKNLDKDTNHVDTYFLFDTQLGKRKQFQNYDALRQSALELGIEPNLQPINTIYSKFRFSWFDVLAGLLFCLGCVFRISQAVRGRCLSRRLIDAERLARPPSARRRATEWRSGKQCECGG
jgi:hypothetical protein